VQLDTTAHRDRVLNGAPVAPELQPAGPGPVELATQAELAGLSQAELQPGLAAVALALGRVMDHPRAQSSKPAAARQLVRVLDELHKGPQPRGSRLSLVKAMTATTQKNGA
jgi:hypothetical protein